MKQVPDSLLAFQHMFPDDDACAAWLIEMRWPDGFVCPACGHEKGWALRRKAHTFECAGCRRQTSVTAGTILHASKLPLTVWFWAAYLMATHSNGISALQLQKQLGIGSYRSAWLLAHKLRASMVDPERNPLSGLVEIDEASLPFRTKDDPPTGGQGRSHDGKMLIVGAIELGDGNIPGRLRLAEISSYGAADLGHFVETAADPDAIAKTDGWSGYAAVPADRHNVHVVGKTAAHLVLPSKTAAGRDRRADQQSRGPYRAEKAKRGILSPPASNPLKADPRSIARSRRGCFTRRLPATCLSECIGTRSSCWEVPNGESLSGMGRDT